ncbi:uncharacterized protein SPPG_04883 [Spizellomyces punctatus DAOM BR117]|uniref:F-box domain-containing protein n=1 Tax=Spizellomyces punctatus (strain DAOM BR117) TaxID=645134 RepID=A0A0L0HEF9_SPIPD|nr:uncharacterized protein SPPG_04883 [Spizellomyces punctatus DAOM BR117]KNC99487.1 hypothetical protein SPPG_04883 [Spizellomyces punctatus DAOM BR117]|eukprot:XP_016607527.1 hypothetical protein SPPG_04883 [Spizellomyces punctatus DAOM BR117]
MAECAQLCLFCGCPISNIYKEIERYEELEPFEGLQRGDATWFTWGVALFTNYVSYPGRIGGQRLLVVDEVYRGDIPKPGATYEPDELPDFEDAAEDSDEDAPLGPFSTSGWIGLYRNTEHCVPLLFFFRHLLRDSLNPEFQGLDNCAGSAAIVHHACLWLAIEWKSAGGIQEFFMSPTGSILECSCQGYSRSWTAGYFVSRENQKDDDAHRDHKCRDRRSKEESVAKIGWSGAMCVDYEAFKTGNSWARWMDDEDYSSDKAWLLTRPDRFPALPLVATTGLSGVEQRQQQRSDVLARLPTEIILAILELLVGDDERSLLRLQSTSHYWRSFFLGDTGLPPQAMQALYRERCVALAWIPTPVDIHRRAKQFNAVLETAAPGTIDWKSYYVSCSTSPSMRNRNRIYRKVSDVYDLIQGGERRRRAFNSFVKSMWAQGYTEDQYQMM